jgi:hypothetical protein
MKLYTCTNCKKPKLATTENFYINQIERASKNENLNAIGKCIDCAKVYQLNYTKKIKEKRLSVRSKKSIDIKKTGTLYIMGPKNNIYFPYKIGITVGKDVSRRLSAIQTSHWMDIQIYYTSPLLKDVLKFEKYLHHKYIDKKVKGEWFNINEDDIKKIIQECENFN